MDLSALIFDVSRTDDTNLLCELREEVEANVCYSDAERAEVRDAINQRFSQLNLLALARHTKTDQ